VNRWELSVAGGALYLTINGTLFEGAVQRVPNAKRNATTAPRHEAARQTLA
jgi:hypothetical protein